MFFRVVRKALVRRRSRLAVAALAVLLATSMVSALVSLSLDLGTRAGLQLRKYGANVLLLPESSPLVTGLVGLGFSGARGEFMVQEDIETLGKVEGVLDYAPMQYLVVKAGGEPVVLAGAELAALRRMNPGWALEGQWPQGNQEALVGSRVAQRLNLAPGAGLEVEFQGRLYQFQVAGVAQTGVSEDSQVLVELDAAQGLSDREGQVDLVQVSALPNVGSLDSFAGELESLVPGSQARLVAQIAHGERTTLSRVQMLMALVATVVMVASVFTMFSTMSASVLERTREVGLMKALGASDNRVALLFLSEAAAIALVGGLAGYLSGFLLAEGIGQWVFDTFISVEPLAFLASLISALALCLLASLLPLRRAIAIEPTRTLRGE